MKTFSFQLLAHGVLLACCQLVTAQQTPESMADKSITELIADMNSDSSEARKLAISEVRNRKMIADDDLPLLMETLAANLNGRAFYPSREAAFTLAWLGPRAKPVLPVLLEGFETATPVWATNLAIAIAAIGEPKPQMVARRMLTLKTLKLGDILFKYGFLQALPNKAVGDLLVLLHDKDPMIQTNAAKVLAELPERTEGDKPFLTSVDATPAAISKALASLIKDENIQVRATAAAAHLAYPKPNLREAIPAMLNGTREAKITMYQAAGLIDPYAKVALPFVIPTLQSSDDYHQEAISLLLTKWPDEAMPVLAEAVKNDSPRIRAGVVRTLGDHAMQARHAAAALDLLRSTLRDENPEVRLRSVEGLLRCSATDVGDSVGVLTELLKARHAHQRRRAAVSLGEFVGSAQSATTALRDTLDDSAVDVRLEAACALAIVDRSQHEHYLPVIKESIETAGHDHNLLKLRAVTFARSLGETAKPLGSSLASALKGYQSDAYYSLQIEMAKTLVRVDADRPQIGIERLLKLASEKKDRPRHIRTSAIRALQELGANARTAVAELGRLMNDDDTNVATSVAVTILKIDPKAENAADFLKEALRYSKADGDLREVQKRRAYILYKLSDHLQLAEAFLPEIIAILQNGDRESKHAAIRLATEMGPSASKILPALRTIAAEDESSSLRRRVERAISKISNEH